jgi:hypothetical protein
VKEIELWSRDMLLRLFNLFIRRSRDVFGFTLTGSKGFFDEWVGFRLIKLILSLILSLESPDK